MDFTHDQLVDGRRFRTLNVLDIFSRECLAVVALPSFSAQDVADVLDQIIVHRFDFDKNSVLIGVEILA